MNNVGSVVRAYGDAWLDVDDAERRRLLEIAWSDDGVYQDPTADVAGREALLQHVNGFRNRFPGSSILLTSGVDHHHGALHFTWKIVAPDGQTTLEGRDFGELGVDGRIRRIVGFFGPPPPL